MPPSEAEPLARAGAVRVIDVRTPAEYASRGHIPGATLFPVEMIASAAATLPREGPPLLVCCEHGVRSAYAAELLARAGFERVFNLLGGMSAWRGPRERGRPAAPALLWPSSWLVESAGLLPRGGRALDVACGSGRHALLLAAAGFSVDAFDSDAPKTGALRGAAARLGLPIRAEVLDLEADGVDLGRDAYHLIVVIHYLHRPLFPALLRALRRGGVLVYETFTVDQAVRGKPSNPDFLLRRGELKRLVAPLRILRKREGEFEGRMVSGVLAVKA